MKPWKLYLDDIRECPYSDQEYRIARSTIEAKELINLYGLPTFMSLDHDLGGEDTSMVFLKWLAYDYDSSFCPEFTVHSANPVGKLNIESFLNSWKRSLS